MLELLVSPYATTFTIPIARNKSLHLTTLVQCSAHEIRPPILESTLIRTWRMLVISISTWLVPGVVRVVELVCAVQDNGHAVFTRFGNGAYCGRCMLHDVHG